MDEVIVRILFFAKARELVQKESDKITISLSTTKITGKNLLDIILEKFPTLGPISQNIVLAANEEYIEPEQLIDIETCNEIAIIPPLSGG